MKGEKKRRTPPCVDCNNQADKRFFDGWRCYDCATKKWNKAMKPTEVKP